MGRRPSLSLRSAGFTLLELLAAIAIFGIMAAGVLINLSDSTDMALGSVAARELRLLSEYRMGQIEVFEREYDDIFDDETFEDLDDERWEGWEWSLFIRDVVIFGKTNDEAAEYLFGDPEEEEDEEGIGSGGDPPAEEREGETQFLRELTLTVRAPKQPGMDGDSDSVTIVTFLPLVDHGPGAPPTTGGNE